MNKIIFILSILMLTIGLITLISAIVSLYETRMYLLSEPETFCKSEGYNFYESEYGNFRCYKEVPSDEGGYKRIYSKTYSIDDYKGEREWMININ